MSIASTGDGVSLGVSLVLIEIPDDDWVRRSIVTALDQLVIEAAWREIGSNSPETSAAVMSLVLQTILFDYEPPAMQPIGAISAWPVATAPAGWLKCEGQSLLRATYPDLFAVLGTAYGAVDGTHFTLPSYIDYSLMGAGSTVAVGAAGGEFLHAITPGEMPIHNHGVTDPGHIHTTTDTGHTHPTTVSPTSPVSNRALVSTGGAQTVNPSGNTGNATTGISINSHATGLTVNNAGDSDPMSLLHPVVGVYFIIYAGV